MEGSFVKSVMGMQNVCVPSILSIAIQNEKIKQVLNKAMLDHVRIHRYHIIIKKF